MNFGTYQKQLASDISSALSKDKAELVSAFEDILLKAQELFKTADFEYWIQSVCNTPLNQLPVTKYGHNEALRLSESLPKQNRNEFKSTLIDICECLFTYSNENEICKFQSDYHFYYCVNSGAIFKQSELGLIEGIKATGTIKSRIAFISELGLVDDSELY